MTKIAFLPFNVKEPVRPALGRQLSHFLSEALKVQPEVETNYVSYLAEVGTPTEPQKAFVNIGEEINSPEFVKELMQQSQVDFVVDGALAETDGKYALTLRVTPREGEPVKEQKEFSKEELFDTIKWMVRQVAKGANISLLPEFADKMEFGTDDPEAFYQFMLGFDGVTYIQQAARQVAREFDIGLAFDSLMSAVEADPDFLGPYESAIHLAQLAAQNGIGTMEIVETRLQRLNDIVPDDWRAQYALGDLYHGSGRPDKAAEHYEKAIGVLDQSRKVAEQKSEAGEDVDVPKPEPILHTRLGLAQQQMNMVANAERSFRKAIDMEGPEKQSMDFLGNLLTQTGRGHEVPGMWKELVDQNPKSPHTWTKYAIALAQNKREDEAMRAFEEGLQATAEDPLVKRYYAPFLSSQKNFDRAMDFYEDCLEVTPDDIPLMIEYAQTLMAAGRIHEVPEVLDNILALNPDQDTRANTIAWKYEVEQPKRMEIMQRAQEMVEKEDFSGAVAELEPLVGWMQDYWKAWALLSSLYNRLGQFEDAEKAARQVLEIFPGCDPAYGELASALVGQGRAEDAYAMLTQVIRHRPNSPQIALNLAMAAKQTGRRDEAARLAKQLREAFGPGNVELEQVLSELEQG